LIANHYVYDQNDGKILFTLSGKRRHAEANAGVGVVVSVDAPRVIDGSKHYHKDGGLVDRPTITIPDETTVGIPVVVDAVPADVDIYINGEVAGVSDGTALELTFDLDGEYEVAIDLPFPWVPIKTTIKVQP
jgi:hypothetical protein